MSEKKSFKVHVRITHKYEFNVEASSPQEAKELINTVTNETHFPPVRGDSSIKNDEYFNWGEGELVDVSIGMPKLPKKEKKESEINDIPESETVDMTM